MAIQPGPRPFQLRKSLQELQSDVINLVNSTHDIINDLFTHHALNSTEFDQLQKLSKSNQYQEQSERLLEYVLGDESGKRASQFYEALAKHSRNGELCKCIVDKANDYLEEWLEVHKLCRDVIQDHCQHFLQILRDVEGLYDQMSSENMFHDFTSSEEQSYKTMTSMEKCQELFRRLLKMDTSNIWRFFSILKENGHNQELYGALIESEKYRTAREQLNQLPNVMFSEVKQSMLKFSYIKPIPEKFFYFDIRKDAEKLLKLQGYCYKQQSHEKKSKCTKEKPNTHDGTTENFKSNIHDGTTENVKPNDHDAKTKCTKANTLDGKPDNVMTAHERRKLYSAEGRKQIEDVDILFQQSIDRVTLVEGNPGSGKTVFLRRWVIDWANASGCQDETEYFIVFIPLRDVRSVLLNDIIFKDLKIMPKKYQPVWEHFVMHESFCKRLIFLLDGADEKLLNHKSDIMKIIEGTHEFFKESRVIITTRIYQNVIKKFKPFADCVVRLAGVNPESRNKFIKHMIGDDITSEDVRHFVSKCKDYHFQEDMLTVPIYLTLLCMLARDHHEKNKDATLETMSLPQTIYRLYETFASIFEDRYLKHMEQQSQHSLKHIKKNIKTLYFLIGRMSFYGLCKEEYTFSLDDLGWECFIEQDMIQDIGFFIEETFTSGSNTYCFYHKTFQEYFAGRFCAMEGFSMTVPHLLMCTKEMFKNKLVIDGLQHTVDHRHHFVDASIHSAGKTLQETLQPLDVAFQFAAGASTQFAKDLLLFGMHTCSIAEGPDSYDTSYASSLVYECHDPEMMHVFADYLLQSTTLKSEVMPVLPSPYNTVVYTFIGQHMSNKSKWEVLSSLYKLNANMYTSKQIEGVFTDGDHSKGSDLLLSCLLAKTVPPVITLKGSQINFEALISMVKKNKELTKLKLANTDLSIYSPDLWSQFLEVIEQLPCLKSLKFPFCNLQTWQFESTFEALERLKLADFDISGNSLEQINEKELAILQKDINTNCERLVIEQNCIKECTSKSRANETTPSVKSTSFKLDHMYTKSLSPILLENSNLTELKVCDTILGETRSDHLWLPVLVKMQKRSKLTHLTLSGCQINTDKVVGKLAETVESMNNLEYFDFSGNNLSNVSDESWEALLKGLSKHEIFAHLYMCNCSIGTSSKIQILAAILIQFSNLESFSIAKNDLSLVDNKQWGFLVSELSKLTKLKHLDTSSCQLNKSTHIATLNQSISQTNVLEHLNLSTTHASAEDKKRSSHRMKEISKLQPVNMSSSRTHSSISFDSLPVDLCSNLQVLDLSGNKFFRLDEINWKIFCANLKNCSKLLHLILSYCNLNQDYHITSLGKTISHMNQLCKLVLSGNCISSIKEDTWPVFLGHLSQTQVSHLEVAKCFIKPSVTNPAACMNFGQLKQLTHLEMPHNRLGDAKETKMKDFITSLKQCSLLVYLKLSKNNLKPIHLIPLAEALGELRLLEHLNLDDNNFYDAPESKWKDFTKSISKCQKLLKLKISKCGLQSGFQLSTIGDMLYHLKELEHLDISENNFSNIDKWSWKQFTSGVKQCRALDKLNLHKCELNRHFHFSYLAELFPILTHLRRLNMDENSFQKLNEDEWKSFLTNMQICKRLQKLQMSGTGLDKGYFWEWLGPVLETLPRLFNLSLSGNNISRVPSNVWNDFTCSIKKCGQLKSFVIPASASNYKRKERQASFSLWQQDDDVSLQQFLDDWISMQPSVSKCLKT